MKNAASSGCLMIACLSQYVSVWSFDACATLTCHKCKAGAKSAFRIRCYPKHVAEARCKAHNLCTHVRMDHQNRIADSNLRMQATAAGAPAKGCAARWRTWSRSSLWRRRAPSKRAERLWRGGQQRLARRRRMPVQLCSGRLAQLGHDGPVGGWPPSRLVASCQGRRTCAVQATDSGA